MLIFDEVMTSRLAWGGAQDRFGVLPDMTTLGKYLAGGMTFGAFGGSRSIMSAFDPATGGALTQAGTFNNNVVTMAAGVATLRDVLTPDALDALNERGDALRERLDRPVRRARCTVHGDGHRLDDEHPRRTDAGRARSTCCFHAMLDAGFYLAPRGMIALSLGVTDDHLDGFCTALDRWLGDRARAGLSRLTVSRRRPRRTMASNSASLIGNTDSRLPLASSRHSASAGIDLSSSSGTKRSGFTGPTVTQSHRGSAGSDVGS